MEHDHFADPFLSLGVGPNDSMLTVEKAYHQLKGLYAEGSLATYSLLDDEERSSRLEQIDQAYHRLTRSIARRAIPLPSLREEPKELPSLPDPKNEPGLFLKLTRERAGISLQQVASRTKIGPMKLDCIEVERFDLLPAPVYLRGFVREFARSLGCDNPDEIAGLYLDRYREQVGEGECA